MLLNCQPFLLIFKTLQLFGFWDPEQLPRKHKVFAVIFYVMFLIFSCLVILAILLIKDANDLSHYLIIAPGFIFLNALTINFFVKRTEIAELIEDIGQTINNEPLSDNYIQVSLNITKNLAYIGTSLTAVCAAFAFLIPLFVKKLIITIWLPYSFLDNCYGFYSVWLVQSWSFFYGGPFFIMIQLVLSTLLIVIRGYQKYFENELRKLDLDRDDGDVQIEKCVVSHLNLKRFMNSINRIFAFPVAFFTLFVGYFWCAIIYMSINYRQANIEAIVTFIMYGILVFIQIFQLCLIGELIESSSEGFAHDIFSSNWIGASPKTKKSLLIIMESMKHKVKFSAFGIVNFNLQTLVGMLHATYSAYAIYQNFSH